MHGLTYKQIIDNSFHVIVEEIEDYAVILLDLDGNIQSWNAGAEKMKGYSAQEIIGKNFNIFYPAEDKAAHLPEKLLSQAKATGKAKHEGWRVKKDGSLFFGNIVLTAVHNDAREVIAYVKVTRDLTEKKKTEDMLSQYTKQLESKNKELEQFTFIASHDLQEPLNTISSFIEIIKADFEGQVPDEAWQFLQYIKVSTDRMHALVRSLLDYGRIGLNPKLESVDCNQLVRSVLDDLQTAIKKGGVMIKVNPLPVIEAYPTELRLLFQNLISNAVKYRKKSGEPVVLVEAEKKAFEWRFSVEDNGIGIDKKYVDKIFAIFYRLHRSEEFDGVGIGLAHCRKIIDLHGGSLWVDSEFDKGSRFTFSIPDRNRL